MDRSDGFAAGVPGDGGFLECAGLDILWNDQHRSTASLRYRTGDRQRMTLSRLLPLVLAHDDQIRVAGVMRPRRGRCPPWPPASVFPAGCRRAPCGSSRQPRGRRRPNWRKCPLRSFQCARLMAGRQIGGRRDVQAGEPSAAKPRQFGREPRPSQPGLAAVHVHEQVAKRSSSPNSPSRFTRRRRRRDRASAAWTNEPRSPR